MSPLPPFYTLRYVEIHSPLLSSLWLLLGSTIVLWSLFGSLLCQHNYVERQTPKVDVAFWQDVSVDGSWWPRLPPEPSSYCGLSFEANYSDNASWGSNHIGCLRPDAEQTQFFYAATNEIRVAFSVADGTDPQYNTSDVFLYEGIEKSTIVFEPSFSTIYETVEHVQNCQAFGPPSDLYPEGKPLPSRYLELYPEETYGRGYMMLSVEDIVSAANRSLDDLGSEAAPLRLAGLVIVARFSLRNYHVALAWPFHYNPFRFRKAADLECTVRFAVLREQFNIVQWFYHGKKPIAVQHGLRLSVDATGSVGYPSFSQLVAQFCLSFMMFAMAQSVLDFVWYYFHKSSETIAREAYSPLYLDSPSASAREKQA